MHRTFAITALLLSLCLLPATHVFAQELTGQEALLTSFEEQLERDPQNTYIQKRIDDTLARTRTVIEQELSALVEPAKDEAPSTIQDISFSLNRQQGTVKTIRDWLQERKVDLELLDAEEERYYSEPVQESGATIEAFRLTKSRPELIAKREILKQRIAVTEALLKLHEDRLQKLTFEARLQQFAFFIVIGRYLLTLLVIWLIERFIRLKLLSRIGRLRVRYITIKIFAATVYIVTFLWILGTILSKHPSILTSFAIIGAGVAIALQDIVKDVFGFFMIHQHHLFSQGQRVTIGSDTGDVIDVGILRSKLLEVGVSGDVLERTGKILSVPNAKVLTQHIINHHSTSDFVRAEMRLTITFESEWRKAQAIFQRILAEETTAYAETDLQQHEERTRTFYIPQQTRGPVVHMAIGADGVEFTLRFSVPIGERRPVVTRITTRILEELEKESSIAIAYKTSRSLSTVYASPQTPPEK